MKQLRVSAIQNGTVIDHIRSENLFKLVTVLGLRDTAEETLIGNHLQSKKLGSKGVIKLSNVYMDQATIDKIALLARDATLITIKHYEVQSKQAIKLPKVLVDSVRCFNPKCITNHESAVTKFTIIDKRDVKLQCHYCEKIMLEPQIEFRTVG